MSLHKRKLLNEIVERQGYVMVPGEIFDMLKGDPSDFVVWAYMFNQSEGWHPSYRQIAEGTGLSERNVMRIVVALVEKGLLIKHINPLGGKNSYEFTPVSSWKTVEVDLGSSCDKLSQAVTKEAPFLEDPILAYDKKVEPILGQPVFKTNPTPVAQNHTAPETQAVPTRDTFKNHKETSLQLPVAAPHATTTPIHQKPSLDEIRLDWESRNQIATGGERGQPDFTQRLALLQELTATLKSHGYSLEDVNSVRFRREVLEHFYKRVKKKSSKTIAEKATLEDWNAALGILVEGTVKISHAPKKPSNHHIAAFADREVDPENQATDEEIDRMLDE